MQITRETLRKIRSVAIFVFFVGMWLSWLTWLPLSACIALFAFLSLFIFVAKNNPNKLIGLCLNMFKWFDEYPFLYCLLIPMSIEFALYFAMVFGANMPWLLSIELAFVSVSLPLVWITYAVLGLALLLGMVYLGLDCYLICQPSVGIRYRGAEPPRSAFDGLVKGMNLAEYSERFAASGRGALASPSLTRNRPVSSTVLYPEASAGSRSEHVDSLPDGAAPSQEAAPIQTQPSELNVFNPA